MLKRLLSKLTGNRQQIEHNLKNQYQVEENGLSFPLSLVDDSQLWALASWLEQLAEEDYLISLTDRWLLSWDALYSLLDDDEHASSLPLSKRAARTVLTGMCYSVGSATRQGSSSLTRFIGQSAMTSRT